ncbi:Dyp-type peroxidase [Streptomyces sp. V4I2]|uniref:Dyp-type peroxidase n=1 Tax=Streptomyces sp. V4I2 TaxID=3042280 RepID=UPI002786CA3F|nr:Dyp-type peroxidase [Streptomyces sp. V4I2]MDQ1042026.1 deferrochelatase/peroxidase EfeB [Streptomyces sp. V4I2]
MTTSRRKVLRVPLAAAAVGAGSLTATGAVALYTQSPDHNTPEPAHLRGAAPLPYAQVVAFDLASAGRRAEALRAAHDAVTAIDGGKYAAWLALGDSILAGSASRPRRLKRMPSFAGDVLDSSQSHGDLLLQITGASASGARQAAARALALLPQWRVRWRLDGNRPETRSEHGQGLARNPFHFTEGYGNPASPAGITERAIVTADQGEPSWAVGGSYQVIRIIRLATDFWDRDSVAAQERIIGRRRDGRWLDGTPSDERPVFTADALGKITPLDAHVRRAAPDRRSPPPLVRRGYNYRRGTGDQGLVFSCFQRDLEKGFEAVQARLEGEAMAKYTLTVGGGYFFVPPPGNTWLDTLAKE